MIPFIPHGITYKDLLVEFVTTKYVKDQQEQILRSIKATFKKLTGYGINELVSDYSYREVIDALSMAKIPHCTFSDWLKKYEWKTRQQAENGEKGSSYEGVSCNPGTFKSEVTVVELICYDDITNGTVDAKTLDPEQLAEIILKAFDDYTVIALYLPPCYDVKIVKFYQHGSGHTETRGVQILCSFDPDDKGVIYGLSPEKQRRLIEDYCAIGSLPYIDKAKLEPLN